MHLRVDERPADGDVDAAAGGAGEEASLRSEMDVVGTGEVDIDVAVAGDRPVLVDVIRSAARSPEHPDGAGIAAEIEIKRVGRRTGVAASTTKSFSSKSSSCKFIVKVFSVFTTLRVSRGSPERHDRKLTCWRTG